MIDKQEQSYLRKLSGIERRVAYERFAESDPGEASIVYHYTDPKGLIGILSDGQLWATDIRYLNDSSELLHAEEMQTKVLTEITQEYPEQSIERRLAEEVAKRHSKVNDFLDTYVVCFSAKDDLLIQWNTYGSRGSGFSIGFDRRKLESSIQPPQPIQIGNFQMAALRPNVHLAKVRYSEVEQKRELRRIFDLYRACLSEKSPPRHIHPCADAIANDVARSAALFKHPCFESEAEWRIIIPVLPGFFDLCFRPSLRTVIPFVKTFRTGDSRLPVVSITIGPTLHQPLSRRSVRALLMTNYGNVEIKASNLPLAVTG